MRCMSVVCFGLCCNWRNHLLIGSRSVQRYHREQVRELTEDLASWRDNHCINLSEHSGV